MPVKRYIPSDNINKLYFFDDFIGSSYDTRLWASRGTGGSIAYFVPCIGGQIRLRANANSQYEIYQNDYCSYSVANKGEIIFRAKIINLTSCSCEWGFYPSTSTSTNWIAINYNSSESANWQIQSSTTAGGLSKIITTVAADTNFHEFKIFLNSSNSVLYFLDNIYLGEITTSTSIPSTDLQPYSRIISSTTTTKDCYIDYIEGFGDR